MEQVRKMVKNMNDHDLLNMWRELQSKDMDNEEIAINAIIETELEKRNVIKLDKEAFEYDLVK